MRTQRFEVVLDRHPSDDDTNAMYEAGLDDCGISIGGQTALSGPSKVYVDRKAPSLAAAIESVTADLASCGFGVVEVVPERARKRSGRPSLSSAGSRSPQVTVVLPGDRERQLVKVAAMRGVKKSDVLRAALYKELDQELAKTAERELVPA